MVVVLLESLVQRGIHGAGGVVSGLVRKGLGMADSRTPAKSLFLPRRQAGHPQTGLCAGIRPSNIANLGMALANRAGRPGCSPQAPQRPGSAIWAGRAILFGWSPYQTTLLRVSPQR
jgi:hypothetical protein